MAATPGLRVQIVLALAGLMLLAFLPLFFAVASLTRASLLGEREQTARLATRAIGVHVTATPEPELARVLAQHAQTEGVVALVAFDDRGEVIASAGDVDEVRAMHAHGQAGEGVTLVRGAHARLLEVVAPLASPATSLGAPSPRARHASSLIARIRADDGTNREAPLVRLVALYMGIFAVALLTFAYFALTRLIVRPIESLVRATGRVAGGARVLAAPPAGARELGELGESVQTMTARLIADEDALRAKVDELTETTRRLTEARAQVVRSERMASVGRLAAGVAHEIGNPIAALLGMEDLLIDGGLDAATEKDFLARMKKETERINGVVRDLLDFSRPEEKSATAEVGSASVKETFDDVIALVKPQKTARSITIEIDADPPTLEVALASSRLTQVLLNLVLNAAFAVSKLHGEGKGGTIRLTARRRDTTV
ncbi:MAG: Sensor histidine kinase, partial [Myxococcaceae bacterium]|nr:Sensor histidine kinase [Myxococcaceae bacterium]